MCGAIACYLTNISLIRAYVKMRTGEFDTTEVSPGVQAWELTAGTGIVPVWVSLIGMFGICFLLAIPFELSRWRWIILV